MKIYYANSNSTDLADNDSTLIEAIKHCHHVLFSVTESTNPHTADAIFFHEASSFKEWRYTTRLRNDLLIGRYPEKTYVINMDDAANGLLRGLYTSLRKCAFNSSLHRAVPYASYPNPLVTQYSSDNEIAPNILASWRGNPKSNQLRWRLLKIFSQSRLIHLENTESWLDHDANEHQRYVEFILASKFSLCPAGWAPVSFRIYESMALARSPVIIADEFIPPDGPEWQKFAVFISENNIRELPKILSDVEQESMLMGKMARKEWERYFSPSVVHKYYAEALLKCISQAPLRSRHIEIKRWQSYQMAWANRWTLPQRFQNKVVRYFNKYHQQTK